MSLFNTNRVLVPVDFSEASFKAQAQTLEFLEDASKLHILHVLPRLSPGDPGVIWNTMNDQTRKKHVEKVFRQRFSGSEYDGAHFQVVVGKPSAAILDYAKTNEIDLIVIPSHGHRGVNRFLLGSVAERVIRFAHCPVLVMRR